jgi:hypothetical protein
MAAGVRADEHEVLSTQRHSAQRTFNRIVVDFDATVLGKDVKGVPSVEGVLDGAVIPPLLTDLMGRNYAAMASRCFGVNPPNAMFGRS